MDTRNLNWNEMEAITYYRPGYIRDLPGRFSKNSHYRVTAYNDGIIVEHWQCLDGQWKRLSYMRLFCSIVDIPISQRFVKNELKNTYTFIFGKILPELVWGNAKDFA